MEVNPRSEIRKKEYQEGQRGSYQFLGMNRRSNNTAELKWQVARDAFAIITSHT